MKSSLATAVAIAVLAFGARHAAAVDLDRQTTFSIPSQPLSSALLQFAEQTRIQVLTASDDLDKIQTKGANGQLTVREALALILNGTHLTYREVGSQTLTIGKPGNLEAAKTTSSAAASPDPIRLAQNTADVPAAGTADEAGQNRSLGENFTLEEIVVSAQKRTERAQDVPVPVTAISGEALASSNLLRIQDYYTRVPGLNFSPTGQVVQLLSIRGLTTGPGNPTVAVMVDDMPYNTATNNGGGLAIPDIDPGDLARVEVLRGPQGTLYGASSLGGLLKFVTVDPSTEVFAGRVQLGLSDVKHGNEEGYNIRGSVNVPVSDTFAVRASAFTRRDPGYVDNIRTDREGVNGQRVSGGRLAALSRLSDTFSLKVNALFQDTKVDGSSDVNGALGELQQDYVRGTGDFDMQAQAYGAMLTGKLGRADLTVVSSYSINEFRGTTDVSPDFDFATAPVYGDAGDLLLDDSKAEKFNQEVRLALRAGDNIEWLLGAFYTHEDTKWLETLHAVDLGIGARVDPEWGSISFPSTYSEIAAFTDVTFRVNERFDVQVGGRQSRIRQASTETNDGALYVNGVLFLPDLPPYVLPKERTRDNAFTYLVTPRFKMSADLMVYARLASGYRTGGTNLPPGVPRSYDPDETQNYELGLKGSFLDRTLSFDASLYYIDWKDIQLSLFDLTTFQVYKDNVSSARSKGVELAFESKPFDGLTLAAWAVWNDAELTADFPPGAGQGVSGDRLPYASRFSGSFSLSYRMPLTENVDGFFGGTLSYVGDRLGLFRNAFSLPDAPRQEYPSYAQTDLHAGVSYEDWTVNLFVNNLTDRRVALTGGLGNFPATAFKYLQPRTVGLSLGKAF